MTPEIIKFPQLSYKGFQIIKGSAEIFEFYPEYIKHSATSDNIWRNTELEIDEEKHFENIQYLDRLSIISVSLCWSNEHKCYDVTLNNASGLLMNVKIREFEQADTFAKMIINWKYNGGVAAPDKK